MKRVIALLIGFCLLPVSLGAQVIEYYHLDAVGNVRAVTDQQGRIIERHDYLPFGEECTTGPCAANPGVGAGQPRKFTGKERDQETGLDYFGARYYGSKIGRFTTVDPVYTWQENLVDPQRWNRYSYADNNPLRYIDPNGKNIFDVISGFANAYGSNFFLGYGRLEPNNPDNAFGQAFGDLASVHTGLQEFAAGAPLMVAGTAATATVEGAPFGVPVAVGGGVVAAHGAGFAVSGALHFVKAVGRSGLAFTRAGKRKIDDANSEKYGGKNVCENCGDEVVPGQRHEQGVRPPNNERHRDHITPQSRGGPGVPENGQVLCRECNLEKSNK